MAKLSVTQSLSHRLPKGSNLGTHLTNQGPPTLGTPWQPLSSAPNPLPNVLTLPGVGLVKPVRRPQVVLHLTDPNQFDMLI